MVAEDHLSNQMFFFFFFLQISLMFYFLSFVVKAPCGDPKEVNTNRNKL